MFHDPLELARYGRKMEGPVTARIFKICDLLALHDLTRRQPQAYILRGWTYILLSCALFLRKSEAANLMISDLSVPRDAVTGKLLLESGLPKVVVVHIRRSKTDQTGQGYIVELHGWYIHCFSGHLCKFRTAAFVAKKLQGPKVVSSDCSYDMASCSQVHHWIIYLHELSSGFHGFESLPETIGFILHISVCRKKYGVDRGAVLPNLTKGSCGKPLVKEAFRKMLHQLVKSMFILPHSLHIDKSFLPLPSTFTCTLNRGWNWNSWSENT